MIAPLAYGLLLVGLVVATWTGLWAGRRWPANKAQLLSCVALEGALTVQSVIAVVRIITGAAVVEPVTFIAYSVGILVPLPLGIYLGRIERTRWGSIAVCFTAVVVAVMALRLLQLWRMGVSGV